MSDMFCLMVGLKECFQWSSVGDKLSDETMQMEIKSAYEGGEYDEIAISRVKL
jgi:hypothetical protein